MASSTLEGQAGSLETWAPNVLLRNVLCQFE
jgi:hypothetical protein